MQTMSSIWCCEQTNMFSLLCPHKFKAYKKDHQIDQYDKNEYIYFEKDNAQKIYLIANGKVKTGYYAEDGTEVIKSILMKGDLFGEKAILGVNNRTEFAQSIDKSTQICPIAVNTMHDLMRDNKTLSVSIYKFLGMRFKKLERRLQLLLFKDTKTRFFEFMQDLSEEYGYDCPETGHKIIKHPYTQSDIASLIGTSRSNLNVLMNELKELKIINFNRKEVIFLTKN